MNIHRMEELSKKYNDVLEAVGASLLKEGLRDDDADEMSAEAASLAMTMYLFARVSGESEEDAVAYAVVSITATMMQTAMVIVEDEIKKAEDRIAWEKKGNFAPAPGLVVKLEEKLVQMKANRDRLRSRLSSEVK